MVDKRRVNAIVRILEKRYQVYSGRGEPFRTLIGCIISQQTKDEVTWPATQRLFRLAKTPETMLRLDKRTIQKTIYPASFYRIKSGYIKDACRHLIRHHNSRVPKTREELMAIPGIGGKCADIVLLYSYGDGVIPVDTHVARISNRLGWTKNKEPEKIREDLHKLFTPRRRVVINNLLVEFGKEICRGAYPKCYDCPIEDKCGYSGKYFKNSKK